MDKVFILDGDFDKLSLIRVRGREVMNGYYEIKHRGPRLIQIPGTERYGYLLTSVPSDNTPTRVLFDRIRADLQTMLDPSWGLQSLAEKR